MANAITQDKIIEINEAYLVIKTYAGVARKVGVCAGTVKKYIIDGIWIYLYFDDPDMYLKLI